MCFHNVVFGWHKTALMGVLSSSFYELSCCLMCFVMKDPKKRSCLISTANGDPISNKLFSSSLPDKILYFIRAGERYNTRYPIVVGQVYKNRQVVLNSTKGVKVMPLGAVDQDFLMVTFAQRHSSSPAASLLLFHLHLSPSSCEALSPNLPPIPPPTIQCQIHSVTFTSHDLSSCSRGHSFHLMFTCWISECFSRFDRTAAAFYFLHTHTQTHANTPQHTPTHTSACSHMEHHEFHP